jgi:hypothetical protein
MRMPPDSIRINLGKTIFLLSQVSHVLHTLKIFCKEVIFKRTGVPSHWALTFVLIMGAN